MDDNAQLGALLRISEVAVALNVSVGTVRRRIRDRELEAVRVGHGSGKSIRVPSSALERLLVPAVAGSDDDV